jgi:cytochrome c
MKNQSALRMLMLQKKDIDHLVNKIINGGGGVWGEVNMPAHPGIKPGEAKQIVDYILSLK